MAYPVNLPEILYLLVPRHRMGALCRSCLCFALVGNRSAPVQNRAVTHIATFELSDSFRVHSVDPWGCSLECPASFCGCLPFGHLQVWLVHADKQGRLRATRISTQRRAKRRTHAANPVHRSSPIQPACEKRGLGETPQGRGSHFVEGRDQAIRYNVKCSRVAVCRVAALR